MTSASSIDQKIQSLLIQKDFESAEKLISEKIKKEPDSADAFYFQGVFFHLQNRIGEAIESLKQCLVLDPRHTDGCICLSILYNDIGRYDEAKKIFEIANQTVVHLKSGDDQDIDRKFAIKHLETADLYFRYRRYDEAIEEYSKAALLDSQNLEIRIRRAKAYAKKGFITRAIQELQQLKAEHPENLPLRIQLGLLHYSQGNVLDAEIEWEGVLENDPAHREAITYLEMAKHKRDENTSMIY